MRKDNIIYSRYIRLVWAITFALIFILGTGGCGGGGTNGGTGGTNGDLDTSFLDIDPPGTISGDADFIKKINVYEVTSSEDVSI